MTFSAEAAVALWQATRGSNLLRLAKLLKEESGVEDIVRDIVLDLIEQHHRPLLARLATAILQAGENLDQRLTWRAIRNDNLREWLEAHDDLGAAFLVGINALADVIEADAITVKDQSEEEVAADVALDLLGSSGRKFRFFKRGDRERLRDQGFVEPPNGGANLPAVISPAERLDEDTLEVIAQLRHEIEVMQEELYAEREAREEIEAEMHSLNATLMEAEERIATFETHADSVEDPLAPPDEEDEEEVEGEPIEQPDEQPAEEATAEPAAEPVEALSVGERAKRLVKIDYPGSTTATRRSRRQRKRR